jgi:hypothetical protein
LAVPSEGKQCQDSDFEGLPGRRPDNLNKQPIFSIFARSDNRHVSCISAPVLLFFQYKTNVSQWPEEKPGYLIPQQYGSQTNNDLVI